MIITTTYEQYKNLSKNKGKDTKTVYKEWLLEEQKLILIYDGWTLPFQMQYNNFALNVYGPEGAGAGASKQESVIPPIPPSSKVTYYTPNGSDGITLGYYTPDLDDSINSYYIYV
jgi:hypothetical protein